MKDGKKSVAEKITYGALDAVAETKVVMVWRFSKLQSIILAH
jgi:ribosomal protein S7